MRRKLSFIEDKNKRKVTFKKRKEGLFKKLNEVSTLCDVKACAVVYNPFTSIPEAWPSKDGVEEIATKFMKLSVKEKTKNMVDHETVLRQMITKEEAQLQKVSAENRDSEMKNIMWGCVRREIDSRQLCQRDILDLGSLIDKYLYKINRRIKDLTEEGESSST